MINPSEFNYPSCWDDDTRMSALFAPFRPKSINPDNYNLKLEFWQTLILNYCKLKKGCPIFNQKELKDAFKRKDKLPFCLDIVVQEMVNIPSIMKYSEYRNASNSWTTWAINGLKFPLKWGYNKLLNNVIENNDTTNYIHINLLKELSQNLHLSLQKHSGKVFSLDGIKTEISQSKDSYLSEDGLKLCLLCLNQQKLILLDYTIIDEEITIKLVKIPGKNMPGDKLTDVDRSMLQLQDTKKSLLEQIQNIEKEAMLNDALARNHIKNSNRKLAEIFLRKKLQLRKTCDKKTDVLNNIETLILNIEDAQSHGEVLSAFESGAQTLRSLVSNSGFTIDKVDEIMSTMKEAVEYHGELQDSISNIDLPDLDDSMLEKELNDLLDSESSNNMSSLHENDEKLKNIQNEQNLINQLAGLNVFSKIPSSPNSKTESFS